MQGTEYDVNIRGPDDITDFCFPWSVSVQDFYFIELEVQVDETGDCTGKYLWQIETFCNVSTIN